MRALEAVFVSFVLVGCDNDEYQLTMSSEIDGSRWSANELSYYYSDTLFNVFGFEHEDEIFFSVRNPVLDTNWLGAKSAYFTYDTKGDFIHMDNHYYTSDHSGYVLITKKTSHLI